jgi:outer membrane protein assembly factor BamB
VFTLAACDKKDKKVDEPAKLTNIASPTVRIDRVWSASVGGGGKKQRLGLGSRTATTLYAAGRDGESPPSISRPANRSGAPRPSWSSRRHRRGTRSSWSVRPMAWCWRWRQRWQRALARRSARRNPVGPAVADKEVVVRTVDGKLRALAAADGAELWSTEQQIPR